MNVTKIIEEELGKELERAGFRASISVKGMYGRIGV